MDLSGPAGAGSLAGRVLHGVLWLVGANATGHVLGLIRVFLLARLVSPADFGLVGLGVIVVSLFDLLSSRALGMALIQKRERAPLLFDTAWTLGLLRSLGAAVCLAWLGPALATLLGAPGGGPILRVMAMLPLIGGLGNIGVVAFRQDLRLQPQYVLQSTGLLAELCVAVPLAWWRRDAWALVAGWLALTVTRVVVSYRLHPYRPRLRLDRAEVMELARAARWFSGSLAMRWLLVNGTQVVAGRLGGVEGLAFYQMAWRLAAYPAAELGVLISGVTFPAYAKLWDVPERLRGAHLRVLGLVALAGMPAAAVAVVHGPDVVRLLLGPRWMPVVPLLWILAIVGVARAVLVTSGSLLQGSGRASADTLAGLVEALGVAAGLVLLAPSLGLAGVALATLAGALGGLAVALVAVRRRLALSPARLAALLGWPLASCVPFALVQLWLIGPRTTLVGLAAALAFSGVLYGLAVLALDGLRLQALDPLLTPWRRPRPG